jgi:hypothetical protein
MRRLDLNGRPRPRYEPPRIQGLGSLDSAAGGCSQGARNENGTCNPGTWNAGSAGCKAGNTNSGNGCNPGGTNTGGGGCTAGNYVTT